MVSCPSNFVKRVDLIISVLTTKSRNKGTQETSGSVGFVLLLWWWWWCHRCTYIPIRHVSCSMLCSVVSDSYGPMDCSPPGSSVHGIVQARTLQWVDISFSRGSSRPRDRTPDSCVSWIQVDSFTRGKPGFDPCMGKIPWRRERIPTPGFWPGESHRLYSPWGSQRVGHDWGTFTFHFLYPLSHQGSPYVCICVNILLTGLFLFKTKLYIKYTQHTCL